MSIDVPIPNEGDSVPRIPNCEAVAPSRGYLAGWMHAARIIFDCGTNDKVYIEAFEDIVVVTANGEVGGIQIKDKAGKFSLTQEESCRMLERWAEVAAKWPNVKFQYCSTQATSRLHDGSLAFRQCVNGANSDAVLGELRESIRKFVTKSQHRGKFPRLENLLTREVEFKRFWKSITWRLSGAGLAVATAQFLVVIQKEFGDSKTRASERLYAWIGAIALSATESKIDDRCWTKRRLIAIDLSDLRVSALMNQMSVADKTSKILNILLRSERDRRTFPNRRVVLAGVSLALVIAAVGAIGAFRKPTVEPPKARLPIKRISKWLDKHSRVANGMGFEPRSWDEIKSPDEREELLEFTDRFYRCLQQFASKGFIPPDGENKTGLAGMHFDLEIKRGANSHQLILRDVIVEVVGFHSVAPTFVPGAGRVTKPVIAIEMWNRRDPLPWMFHAKWVADDLRARYRPFEGEQTLITGDDWNPFLLKLLAIDRGIYQFNIDVVLQQDDEPETTVRVTEEPITIGFFSIPGKDHPDHTFLRNRYMDRGGMIRSVAPHLFGDENE